MTDPRFGLLVTTRMFHTVRAMLLAPTTTFSQGKQNWHAIVLRDEEEPAADRWTIGSTITIAPEGDHVIEITEDED